MKKPEILSYADRRGLAFALADYTAKTAKQAIAERGVFTIALSGGSALSLLAQGIIKENAAAETAWHAWQVFWADERCVPLDNALSNYAAARQELLDHVPIPRNHIHTINDQLPAAEAAEAYAARLAQVFQPPPGELPRFDLVLLGIGEDGHTASLFPNHPVLNEKQRWVALVQDAPKPPPLRITLTLPVLNNARHVAFTAAGNNKKAIINAALHPQHRANYTPPSSLPARLVQPADGELTWFIGIPLLGQA